MYVISMEKEKEKLEGTRFQKKKHNNFSLQLWAQLLPWKLIILETNYELAISNFSWVTINE